MKRLNTLELRKQVTSYIAIAMFLLGTVSIVTTEYIQDKRVHMQEMNYAKQIDLGVTHVLNHYLNAYRYRTLRIIKNENVVELLKSRNREALYTLLKIKWNLMKEEEPSLSVMQFHLPDGNSFLRMHNPQKFGDKLSSIRPMIKEIHVSHKPIHGYETGRYGTVYRIITPIFDEKEEYLGCLEIGLSPNFILDAVRETNNFSGMMFIKEDSLALYSLPSDRNIDGYRLQSKLTPRLKSLYKEFSHANKLENDITFKADNKIYRTHLFILNSFHQEPRVKIVFFQDITDFGLLRKYFVFGILLFMVMGLSLLIWLVYRRIGLYQKDVDDIYTEQIERLNESEQRFALLYSKAPEAYQSLDENGNILMLNTKWTENLGYTEEEVVGKNFSDFMTDKSRKKFREVFPKFKVLGEASGVEFEMVRKDKKIVNVSLSGKIVNDDYGDFIQTHCIFSNITEQKIVQEKIAFNEEYMQAIFDVIPDMMITSNGKEIDKANPAMLNFFSYDTLEAFKSQHECICDYFIAEEGYLTSKINNEEWLEYILSNPDTLHKVCMEKDSKRHHFIVKAHHINFDKGERSTVIFSDITNLEEIGEQLRYAVNGTNDGLWDWNVKENTIYFSPRWKEMLGYEDDEVPNIWESWESRVHPDDIDKVKQRVALCFSNPEIEFKVTHRLLHKDGSWVWILARAQIIFDENSKALRMVGFHTDLTDQKLQEAEISKLGILLNNTMNSLDNLVFVKDTEFRYIAFNPAFEKFMGVYGNDLLGKNDYDIFDKEVADFFREKDKEMFASNGTRENYEWVTYPDGTKHYLLTAKTPLRDTEGKILGLVGNSVDMTQHKKLEDDLRASQEQFEQFMNFLPANIIIKNESKEVVYANNAAKGFFAQNIIGKTIEEMMSEQVAKLILKTDKKAMKEGSSESLIDIVDSEGKKRIFRNLTFIIKGDEETKLGMVSTDITREYIAQHEVSRLKSALDRSPISIMMTDIHGNIEYVNPNYIRVSGYSAKELIGKNPRIVKSGFTTLEKYKEMWATISRGDIWNSDVKNIAKDGSIFWEDSTILPTFDEYDNIEGYIAFKLDITEKVAIDKQLHDQEEVMIAQSRHAAMGEMISMIAHQWRQPISVIAMDANNILADVDLEMIEEESLREASIDIIKQTQELSSTIDDFRNFFKPEKVPEEVFLVDVLHDALGIIGKSLENNNILLSSNVDKELSLRTYSRELMQVFVNLINNSKEALLECPIENRKIEIGINGTDESVVLDIYDNAGGIDEKIIENIFDPYFSTKGEKNGTGLGLYMSRTIVEKHMHGKLEVQNINDGACFTIKLPIVMDANEVTDEHS